jgi:hypothetical protein
MPAALETYLFGEGASVLTSKILKIFCGRVNRHRHAMAHTTGTFGRNFLRAINVHSWPLVAFAIRVTTELIFEPGQFFVGAVNIVVRNVELAALLRTVDVSI